MRFPVLLTFLAGLVLPGAARAADTGLPPDRPLPARHAIVDLLTRYQVVGLAETHGSREFWTLINDMVRVPSLGLFVDDITFECGNVRFQDLVDRYVMGAPVTEAELKPVWRDNVLATTICDSPVYLEFLRALRQSNMRRAEPERIRALLIDPPVDWGKVTSAADVRAFNRETHMREVLEREVYAKGRRALFIAGESHLQRGETVLPPPGAGGPMPFPPPGTGPAPGPLPGPLPGPAPGPTPPPSGEPIVLRSVLATLEGKHPGTTVMVGLYTGNDRQAEFEGWAASGPVPWVLSTQGNWLSSLTPVSDNSFIGPGGPGIGGPPKSYGELTEALLYLGRRADLGYANPVPVACTDAAWVATLRERDGILGRPPASPIGTDGMCAEGARTKLFPN